MTEQRNYSCEDCGKTLTLSTEEEIPECCGKKMVWELEPCTSVPHAEMARVNEDDDVCDDGRGHPSGAGS
jgi:hypothetical protein